MALGQTDIVATLDARLGRFYGQVFGATPGEPVLFTAEAPEGLRAAAAIGPGAAALGLPKGQRAVGRACATNPVSLLIPCHRALRSDGKLAGYRWGLERKKALIALEASV